MDKKGAGVHATEHGPGLPPFAGDPRIACRPATADQFFHPEGERGKVRWRRQAQAKALCYSCPLIAACAEWSIEHKVSDGTWGGLTEKERQSEILRRAALGNTLMGVAA